MESNKMNWLEFRTVLEKNSGLPLQFRFSEEETVDPSYHITEVKQAPITSVDCGGVVNSWTEIIVQLWEPEEKEVGQPMPAEKALKIFNLVESKIDLHPKGIVKIEFGNHSFDTRQMFPSSIGIEGNQLVVDLQPDAVQCKATSRGQTCGTPKQKKSLAELPVVENVSCTPGGGCC